MLKSILIGLDGSVYGNAAVELGIRWARRFDALLVGLGIIDEPTICKREPVAIGAGYFKQESDRERLQHARRLVETFLEHFVQKCAEESVRCKVLEDVGMPYAPILQESKMYDLIMLGQQTYFHFETQDWPDETLRKILRHASRPVVTVPEAPVDDGCVIVAYDGSLQADRALQAFQSLSLRGDDQVRVLSIDSSRANAEQAARQAVDFLSLHGVEAVADTLEPAGSIGNTIVSQVRIRHARLLVMGAYGRSMWREFIFGSTTSKVLGACPAPLFLCH